MFCILCRRNVVIHGQDRVDSGCPGLEQALLRIRDDIDAVIRLDEEPVIPGKPDIQLAILDRPFEQGVE